jgi:seryl-tRNA synthetase
MMILDFIRDNKYTVIGWLNKNLPEAEEYVLNILDLDKTARQIKDEIENFHYIINTKNKLMPSLIRNGNLETAEEVKKFIADTQDKINELENTYKIITEEINIFLFEIKELLM